MNNREFILVKISLVLVLLIPPGELSPRPLSVDDEFSRVDFGPIARNDYDQGDTGDETLGGSNTAF
ncbi:hypothetical protein TCAL_17463 [Tigriopus californicus]|nr:hypothetical protein TCAL_17463 [Tigriopus californicus]